MLLDNFHNFSYRMAQFNHDIYFYSLKARFMDARGEIEHNLNFQRIGAW